MLYYARRYDEALAELRQAAELQPDSSAAEWWMVRCLLKKGMVEQAILADITMRRNRDKLDDQTVAGLRAAYARGGPKAYWTKLRVVMTPISSAHGASRAHLVDINLRLGDKEEALRWLEKSANLWAGVEPEFDSLRGDPGFEGILRRIHRALLRLQSPQAGGL